MWRKFPRLIEIYCPFQNIKQEWIARVDWPAPIKISETIPSESDFKIAWIWIDKKKEIAEIESNNLLDLARSCQLVFVMDTEIHDFTYHYDNTKHLSNLYWIGPGRHETNKNQWIVWHDHLARETAFYKNFPEIISTLGRKFYTPLFFDALLGNRKPHRDFIKQSVDAHDLAGKFVMSYHSSQKINFEETDFIWESGCKRLDDADITQTSNQVDYHGRQVPLAMVIPTSIYSRTCYSVVAETNWQNQVHMISEKMAKPILAKRPFVVFSGQGFLQFFRESGFQTFDPIIDESYDQIKDDKERWEAAFDQVRWLCEQDQLMILNACESVLEHNFQKLWQEDFKIPAITKIQTLINEAYKKYNK